MHRYILFVILFFLGDIAGYSQYSFRSYTIDDGLMSNNVTCSYRDSRGFLWIGSRSGLQVYNGKYFRDIRHDLLDSNSLSGDWVMSIAEDKDGFIWVGTDKGICRIHPGHLRCKQYKSGLNIPAHVNPSYSKLIASPTGIIYAITSNGILELKGDQFQILSPTSSSGCLSFGISNNLLFAYFGVVVERDMTSGRELRPPIGSDKKMDYTCIYQDVYGNYWLGTWADGLFRYDANWKNEQNFKWDPHPANPSTTNIINGITGDSQFVYISTFNGIYLYDIQKSIDLQLPFVHLTEEPNLSNGISTLMINHIYVDEDENVWVSTDKGLNVNLAISREYQMQPTNTGYTTDLIWKNKQLIASSWYGKGLYFFDKDLTQVKTIQYLPEYKNELDNSQISGLDVDDQGNLWAATFNGLVEFDPVHYRTIQYITKETGLATNRLNDVWVNERDSTVWTANYDDGLSIYDLSSGKTKSLNTKNDSTMISDLVWSFYDDHKQNLWILTNSGIIRYNYVLKEWKHWVSVFTGGSTIEIGRVNALILDSRGIIWIGTENGLFIIMNDQWYFKGLEHGLPERSINGIVEDNAGNMWLSFPHSILHYDVNTLATSVLSSRSGIALSEIHLMFRNPFTDQLYLVADNHFYELHKENILKNKTRSPIVYLEEFQVNNSSFYSKTDSFSIEKRKFFYDQNNVEIVFNTPVIGEIGTLNYSYRIGSNGDWSTPAPNNRIILPELQPGNYVVEIRASTDGTHWSQNPLKVEFIILPPFWATWWFRILILVLAILLLIFIVRYISTRNLKLRILKLEKDQAVEKERSRLSRDMHDDLGSGLTKIAILSEVVKKKMSKDEKLNEYLDNISGSSRELVQSLNNIIWSLNRGNDTWSALIAYIREYAANFLEGCQVEFEFKGPADIPEFEVSEQVKRNIYLVVKETLNNSVKHGKATAIILQLEQTSAKSFSIRITDNGSGRKTSESKGNGFKNMEKRMTEIGGKWNIEFMEGEGTMTTLSYTF